MRILFISREYPPETGFGGIAAYVACIGPALRARGHDVHVLSCVRDQAVRDYEDSGVWVHRRRLHSIRGVGRMLGLPASTARISAAFSSLAEVRRLNTKFDVVEIPDYLAEGLFISGRTWPTVASLHTPMRVIEQHAQRLNRVDRWLGDRLERLAVRRADIVTSPTRRLVESLPHGWVGSHSPQIVRLPIDFDRWSDTKPVEATPPVVLHTGRLEALKAPEVLVEATARLAAISMDIEAWFVGASGGVRNGLPYQEWLEGLARELGAACRFFGHVPRDELPGWLSQARVAAIPSRDDNFPMAGVEAMAAGRPLVCTSAVGLAEILYGTDAGTVVPPDDPEAFAAALRPYLEDRGLAARAGQAARRLIKSECAAEVIAAKRERVYEEAIAHAASQGQR